MRIYRRPGQALLVCPRLVELDPRHGEHSSRWPNCRRGERGGRCHLKHEHESELVDPEGHTATSFLWVEGCRPPTAEEWPACACGLKLVHTDLDDPLHPDQFYPQE